MKGGIVSLSAQGRKPRTRNQQLRTVLRGLKDEVTMLTPYAVEARYPEFEEPLLEDAREMVRIARGIRDFVLVKLPETLTGTE